jgi:hypothetical protein
LGRDEDDFSWVSLLMGGAGYKDVAWKVFGGLLGAYMWALDGGVCMGDVGLCFDVLLLLFTHFFFSVPPFVVTPSISFRHFLTSPFPLSSFLVEMPVISLVIVWF